MTTLRPLSFLCFAVALSGCGKGTPLAPPSGSTTEADDLKLLAAKWGVDKIDAIGDRVPPKEFFDSVVLELKGNILSAKDDGLDEQLQIKLDPAKSPKEIVITPLGKDGKPRESGPDKKPDTMNGIYKIEGDTVVVALSAPNQPRPTEFKAIKIEEGKKDSGVIVVTFKKLSDDEAAKRAKAKPEFVPPMPKKD